MYGTKFSITEISGSQILQLLNCPVPKFYNYRIVQYQNSPITDLCGTQIL